MTVIQFRQDFFHDGLAVQHRLGRDMELVTIEINGSHLTVIQINDLTIASSQGLLLLLQIFRIDRRFMVSFLCHFTIS